jgi:thiol-disulfide isomerase/thioredoxin
MPVLMVEGNGDTLVKPEGTWELFNDVATKDKSFFAVPGEHLIFEDADTQEAGPRDQNFRVIQSWLTAKVGRRHRSNFNTASGSGPSGGTIPGQSALNLQGLEAPAQLLDAGQYANAITQLEQIQVQHPGDPNVLGLLGKAYLQNGQPDKARYYFRSAMRARRGNGAQASAFNSYILGMSGGNQPSGSSSFGTAPGSTLMAPAARPKIYAFYATWADQCKTMNDALSQLNSKYGRNVDIEMVNIEDSAHDSLADKFNVGPIPTVVFLAPDGQVSSTIIGESTYGNYEQALQSISPQPRAIQ